MGSIENMLIEEQASRLVNTSVDDCRSSLHMEDRIPVIERALEMAIERGHKTREKLLRSKLYQLRRGKS